MFNPMIASSVAAAIAIAGLASAQTPAPQAASAPMSKDGYTAAKNASDDQYNIDKVACSLLFGNAKDICVAEVSGKDRVAKADARAAYENTPSAREGARDARAQASYDVAVVRCDDLARHPKDTCVEEAKAALVRGKADAMVDGVAVDARQRAVEKETEARMEANDDRRDAEYSLAVERCRSLAGAASETCLGNAKLRYGKS
jgi:hypothetical protein